MVAEIQQTSDVTYRIYDFNRLDENGNARELHVDLAVDAIDYQFEKNYRTEYNEVENVPIKLIECQYFTTDILKLSQSLERDFTNSDTFVIYMCLEGDCLITWEGKSLEFYKGETILVPAIIDIFELSPINGNVKLLEVYI